MNISILVSLIGIIVSIAIGLVTFLIADRRSSRNRWLQAKDTILQDLSVALGEGNVPNMEIIRSTTRSVLRIYNPNSIKDIAFDEILDDLIRKITSDPFLNVERRTELQEQVLALRSQIVELEAAGSTETFVNGKHVNDKKSIMISSSVAGCASLASSFIFFNLIKWLNPLETVMGNKVDLGIPLLSAINTVLILLLINFFPQRFRIKRQQIG